MNYMLDTDTFNYIMHHCALPVVETLDEKTRTGHVSWVLCLSR